MSMRESSPFLSTKAAAERLGYSESTLEKYRHTGDGPPYLKIGKGRIAYDVTELDRWARSRSFRSTSEYKAAPYEPVRDPANERQRYLRSGVRIPR